MANRNPEWHVNPQKDKWLQKYMKDDLQKSWESAKDNKKTATERADPQKAYVSAKSMWNRKTAHLIAKISKKVFKAPVNPQKGMWDRKKACESAKVKWIRKNNQKFHEKACESAKIYKRIRKKSESAYISKRVRKKSCECTIKLKISKKTS